MRMGYHRGEVPYLAIAMEYDVGPIVRECWRETKSVQQVAERCLISPGEAHRLIVAMLREEGEE